MLDIPIFTLNPGRGYSNKEFRRDLKVVLNEVGVEGKKYILFVEDHHLLEPGFLEVINSLISAGEAPGLYAPEEVEPML